MEKHAVKHRGVEVIGLHFQRALEIRLGAIEIAVVEEHLAEEERELVVVAIELERFFERLDPALGIERVDRRFGVGDQLEEAIALVAAEERHDAVLALGEPLLLFERQHLVAHLRFPELDELVGGDDVLLFEELFDGEEAGLVDEDRALVLLDGVDDRAEGFGGALHDLFEGGDALEEVLIQGEIALFVVVLDLVLFERGRTGENHQLVLTAIAVLALVVVEGAAGLAEHRWSL